MGKKQWGTTGAAFGTMYIHVSPKIHSIIAWGGENLFDFVCLFKIRQLPEPQPSKKKKKLKKNKIKQKNVVTIA